MSQHHFARTWLRIEHNQATIKLLSAAEMRWQLDMNFAVELIMLK